MIALRRPGVLWFIGGVLAVFIAAGSLWAARSSSRAGSGPEGAQDAALLVSVIVPGRRAVSSDVSFTGSIAARYEMRIGPEGEGGRITGVFVEAGDRVKRGQLLTRLDQSVPLAQLNSLEAALEEARAQRVWSNAEYERALQAGASGAFSKSQTERLAAAALGDEAKVKVAAAQLAEARARLQRTEIRAPNDGLVLTRDAEVGQTAAPGDAEVSRRDGGVCVHRGATGEQHGREHGGREYGGVDVHPTQATDRVRGRPAPRLASPVTVDRARTRWGRPSPGRP